MTDDVTGRCAEVAAAAAEGEEEADGWERWGSTARYSGWRRIVGADHSAARPSPASRRPGDDDRPRPAGGGRCPPPRPEVELAAARSRVVVWASAAV